MGNTLSVPEEAEDDKTCTVKSYQALSESPDSIKNGSVVFVQSPPLAGNGEAAEAGSGRDSAAVSPAEPAEQRGAARAGGSAARRAEPAARPRSVLAFPWAVPGRAEQPAQPPAPAQPAPDATGLNKGPSEGAEGPGAAEAQEGSHKNLGQAPLQDVELEGTPEGHDVAAPKAKALTLFDRIFRPEKGKGRTRGDPQEGRQGLDVPNGNPAAGAPNEIPLDEEIDECTQKELGQDSAGEQGPAAAAPGRTQVEQDSPQAAAGQGSVMSFLKTLVSPSKAEAKSDSEDKGSKAEKGPGGQPGPKAAAESPSKGAKKKKAESPKLGHSTFSKLFRHKAAKETQQTTNTKSPEQPPVTCVKADRNVPPSQEPPAKQNPKAPEAATPAQGVGTETPREATKDKGSATPLPLSKLFWKKNSSEEAEAVSNEKAEAALEAVAPDRDESKSSESAELKPRGAESKTPKANLRKFFKLSVKGDGGTPSSEEGDGPSPRHHGWFDLAVFAHGIPSAPWDPFPEPTLQELIPTPVNENLLGSRTIPPCQTLNATEKPLAPSESDPGGQRSKESSKDKKFTVELGKQKGREQPEPQEQPAADPDSIQNGGDAKEPSYKKTEKRQSLGGFFKGLGSKRMSDAEVQTDPVSILPAGKSK
ncbi:breast carcinoma-amplified sequence 1 isoform X2 [Parus major]|uniref:breast carcinoma-amplified sequence 1 isoform X2 n=1 Tax=Parus major TaxID=9157 RepID=UPI0008F4B696|nr:breast carcinoma-amplified sequence 1 isoform X2 [Parus major]